MAPVDSLDRRPKRALARAALAAVLAACASLSPSAAQSSSTPTAGAGSFAIERVPRGRYRLVTWHERGQPLEQDVEVRAGADTRVAITYPGPVVTGTQPRP
jgi:hypothetical protein